MRPWRNETPTDQQRASDESTTASPSLNGLFGFYWSRSLPVIARKIENDFPPNRDAEDSGSLPLSDAEDLVSEFERDANAEWSLAKRTHDEERP